MVSCYYRHDPHGSSLIHVPHTYPTRYLGSFNTNYIIFRNVDFLGKKIQITKICDGNCWNFKNILFVKMKISILINDSTDLCLKLPRYYGSSRLSGLYKWPVWSECRFSNSPELLRLHTPQPVSNYRTKCLKSALTDSSYTPVCAATLWGFQTHTKPMEESQNYPNKCTWPVP